MLEIKAFFEERKRIKRNWKEIIDNSQNLLNSYNPDYRYYGACLKEKTIEKTVLYESGNGRDQLSDLSRLFESFVKRLDFEEYQHVWVFHKKKDYRTCKKKYSQYKNVDFLLIEEEIPLKYYELLATASHMFQGGNFPSFFVKREGQFFLRIQEFHPEKQIGYENDADGYQIANHMRNLLMADGILVRDEAACERLDTAYRLRGIYQGTVFIANPEFQAHEILETIWDNKCSVKTENILCTVKKKILIYGGGMAVNGVTEALLALLNVIDYSSYDVTVFCWLQDKVYSRGNIARIDKRARVLVSRGTDPMTEEEHLSVLYLKKYGLTGKGEEKIHKKIRHVLKRAALRRFGNTSFDYLIDFSGYAVWIPLLLLEVPAKKRFIWEHPDLKEDFATKNDREAGNKDVQLEGLLSMYEKFDRIVAVNEPLMNLNREKLGNTNTMERFRYSTNILNRKRLEEKIAKIESDSLFTGQDGRKYLVYDSEHSSIDGTIKMLPLQKEEGAYRFVTMGRLSQEKNHANLILAFGRLLKEYPKSRLFIIGQGVLKESLQELTIRNKLEKNVIFTGNLTNPFLLMKHCDCFILPSCHEGQGLVILEARLLHMPIILSRYDTASSVCVEKGQYMIGMEQEDILQGLTAFIQGEVPCDYQFNLEEYNKKAIREFYQILED